MRRETCSFNLNPLDGFFSAVLRRAPRPLYVLVYGGVWETLFPGVPVRVLGASPMFYVVGAEEVQTNDPGFEKHHHHRPGFHKV